MGTRKIGISLGNCEAKTLFVNFADLRGNQFSAVGPRRGKQLQNDTPKKHCNTRIQQGAFQFRVILVLFCWLVILTWIDNQLLSIYRRSNSIRCKPGMHAPKKEGFPRPAPKKEGLPRPAKINKTCGAQRGKVDFNPLKSERQLQRRKCWKNHWSMTMYCLYFFVYWPKFVQALQWCASSLTGAESYGMDRGLTKQSGRTFGGSGRPFLAVGEFTTWQKDPQNMGGKVSKHDKEVILI